MNKEIDDVTYKKYLLEEMVYFDYICEKNELTYFLFYGSLLGAIRHKGFIPWDDDIDIIMPRKDYYKLIEVMKDDVRYEVVSMHNNDCFTAPLAKMVDRKTKLVQNYGYKEKVELGIYIDIFILDGLPEDKKQADKYYQKAKQLTKCWGAANHAFRTKGNSIIKDIVKYIYYLPCHILGDQFYLKKIDKFASKYNFYDSKYVGNLMFTTIDKVYYKIDFTPIYKEFEGHMFCVPKGYERILAQRYGNWKKLPPIDKRTSHHDFWCGLK